MIDCINNTSRVYITAQENLQKEPKHWLITGVAGFIGSNLLERLLRLDQTVVGLDNFSMSKEKNLQEVKSLVSEEQWAKFTIIEGDIRELENCQQACRNIDYVLH